MRDLVMIYRINGFDQIKSFYSLVFEQKYEIKPQHISLYIFLINQNNRNNWVEWFKCPFDLAMAGACIGNKRTYYNCLDDLQEWKLIKYEKGINNWKAPKIKIEVLKCTASDTASVPQSEPAPQQLLPPAPQQLLPLIYKHITSKLINKKHIIELKKFIDDYLNESDDKVDNNDIKEVYDYYPSKCPIKNRSTSKGNKDKEKIERLLNSISKDELIFKIKTYIEDCKKSNTYVKNFSSFLNNLPDYSETKKHIEKTYSYRIHFTTFRNKSEKQYKEDLKQYGKELKLL